eukprot:503508-Amphidinium_carterae.1
MVWGLDLTASLRSRDWRSSRERAARSRPIVPEQHARPTSTFTTIVRPTFVGKADSLCHIAPPSSHLDQQDELQHTMVIARVDSGCK